MIAARIALIAASIAAALFPALAPAVTSNPVDRVRTSRPAVSVSAILPAGASRPQTVAWVTADSRKARGTGCTVGSTVAARKFGVRADMVATGVRGAKWMRVRFRLLRSTDSGANWADVIAQGLGEWEAWYPATKHPYLTKVFTGLGAGVSYRSDVDFEWADSARKQVRTQTLRSPTCNQPDLRPDLHIDSVTSAPVGTTGKLRWSITVRNSGKGRSASGRVSLLIGTTRYPTGLGVLVRSIDEAGSRRKATKSDPLVFARTVIVDAPQCADGGLALVEFTPDNVLDDSNTANNVFPQQVDCSKPTG